MGVNSVTSNFSGAAKLAGGFVKKTAASAGNTFVKLEKSIFNSGGRKLGSEALRARSTLALIGGAGLLLAGVLLGKIFGHKKEKRPVYYLRGMEGADF